MLSGRLLPSLITFRFLVLLCILFDPLELSETGLPHGESDLTVLRILLVEIDADDPCPDYVSHCKESSAVFSYEPLVGLIDVHTVIHYLADVKESIEGTESDESAELEDLYDHSLDDLVLFGLEDDLIELHRLIDRAVSVNDASRTLGPDIPDQ